VFILNGRTGGLRTHISGTPEIFLADEGREGLPEVPFDSRRPGFREGCRAPAALLPPFGGLEGGYFHRAELQSAVLCLIRGQGQIATVDQTVLSHRWRDGYAWANFHSSAWSDCAGRRGTNSGFTITGGLGGGARGAGCGCLQVLEKTRRKFISKFGQHIGNPVRFWGSTAPPRPYPQWHMRTIRCLEPNSPNSNNGWHPIGCTYFQ